MNTALLILGLLLLAAGAILINPALLLILAGVAVLRAVQIRET